MSNTSSIFALFAFLVGVMLFGIWSNIHAYAQQSSSSPTLSAASPPTGNSVSKSISPELKAQMCDPTNPNLKVVNTTEAHICQIPKTVKPPLASAAATPKTSTVTSLIQQAPTRKPASANITALKQQQIKAVNNTHVNGISRPADGAAGTTISQVTRPPTNTSSPSSLAIAPQINAVNQEQQAPLIPITRINGTTGTNGTAGQNHTFQATSPVAASGKLLYLVIMILLLLVVVAQPMAIVVQKIRAVKLINLLLTVVVQAVPTIAVHQKKLRGTVAAALVLNHLLLLIAALSLPTIIILHRPLRLLVLLN